MLVINNAAIAKLTASATNDAVRPNAKCEEPAQAGADRDHRAPRRADQRGCDRKVFGVDQIGQRGLRRRTEERTEHTDARLRDEDQEHRPVERAEEDQRRQDLRGRHHDHHQPPIETVGDRSGDRRKEERGKRLRDEHQRGEQVGVGAIAHETEDRDGREPVAAVGDQLREKERAKVAIATEELQH